MENLTASEIIDRLGGTAEVARICHIKPPSVSELRSSGIPPARRQFLELLSPEAFVTSSEAVDGHVSDKRISKRALRTKLGLSTDKQLAKVLQLPVEQVSAWADEGMVPALPQVMKLLGLTEQQEPAKPANDDPDADRIAPIEVA
ncbi:hypothetical protein CR919_15000 [Stenotrophomonas sp. LMG 10879]|uniref:hypothetical protein n=1 Tax=Stenotrophomonas sp. LMG 10879 TaxID=487706 RepID=UPI000C188652|nr:hypothetical protein [Stenotrophomonas sp. LMG 10879]PII18994.1 hypothetical protein CR919_15000 [Stenotrophomonas sp. LMG 10879]